MVKVQVYDKLYDIDETVLRDVPYFQPLLEGKFKRKFINDILYVEDIPAEIAPFFQDYYGIVFKNRYSTTENFYGAMLVADYLGDRVGLQTIAVLFFEQEPEQYMDIVKTENILSEQLLLDYAGKSIAFGAEDLRHLSSFVSYFNNVEDIPLIIQEIVLSQHGTFFSEVKWGVSHVTNNNWMNIYHIYNNQLYACNESGPYLVNTSQGVVCGYDKKNAIKEGVINLKLNPDNPFRQRMDEMAVGEIVEEERTSQKYVVCPNPKLRKNFVWGKIAKEVDVRNGYGKNFSKVVFLSEVYSN